MNLEYLRSYQTQHFTNNSLMGVFHGKTFVDLIFIKSACSTIQWSVDTTNTNTRKNSHINGRMGFIMFEKKGFQYVGEPQFL